MMRSLQNIFFALFAVGLTACGAPCPELEQKLCNRLEADDCASFKDAGGVELLAPTRRHLRGGRNALRDWIFPPEDELCRLFGADANFEDVTVPQSRFLARHHRDPVNVGSPPTLPALKTSGGLFGGSWMWRLLPFLLFAGIMGRHFVRARRANRE